MKKFLALFIVLGLCLSVLVGCLDPLFFGPNSDEPQETALEKAHTFLHEMYWYDAKTTPADYTLVTQIIVDDKTFTITWTVEIDSAFAGQVALVPAEDGKITVDVNEMAESDIAYKLIGSITDGKETLTVSFERIVPKYREFGFVDYVAAEKDAAVVVSGVVSGIISKSAGATRNCLYVNDSVGGYYVYDLTDDPVTAGIKVGQTVKITGKKDIYNGTYEIVKATVEIVDETIQALVPEDYTNIFASAAALTDEALVANQAHLVTIKNVEITGINAEQGYYKFKLGDLESYIRISSSTCPLTAEEQATFKAEHAAHTGYLANATGVICVYSGAFYLTPVAVDAFEYLGLPEKSDAEAIAYEKENLIFTDKIKADAELDLVSAGATYDKVSISWALDAEYDFAAISDGKLTVTLPEEATEITLIATLTAGEESDTKDFVIAVSAAPQGEWIFTPNADAAEGTFVFVIEQNNLATTLYFDGTVNNSEFLATTDDPAAAAEVVIAQSGEGYTLMSGNKYIEVYENASKKVRPRLVDEPTAFWTFDEDLGVFTFVLTESSNASNDGVYYLGTYNNFNTFSASKISFISGDNAANVGISQFPGVFGTLSYELIEEDPFEQGTYLFVIEQNQLAKTLYFDGTVNNSEFLATTENIYAAAQVVVAKVEGGYTLATGNQYIEVYENASKKVRPRLVDEPTAFWTFDEDLGVFTFVLTESSNASNDGVYYLGTYNNFNTFSASKISFISGDNAANVGVSQFPGQLIAVPAVTDADKVAAEKEALAFTAAITESGEFDLAANGTFFDDVAIAWALDAAYDFAAIADGKLTVTLPDEATEITLTATITAGEESDTKEFVIAVSAAPSGETPVAVTLNTLTFPDDNHENNKVSSYSLEWTAIKDNQSWTITNFNNNNWNNSWTQIRCGSKNAASVASISTTFAATVTEITLTFDSADASKVNAFRLEINGVEAQTKTIAGGAITFVIADPAPNQTYTIVIDCAQGSSNGFVRLSQIEVQGYTA